MGHQAVLNKLEWVHRRASGCFGGRGSGVLCSRLAQPSACGAADLSDRTACLLPYCLHCVHCLYCLYRSYYNRDFMYLLKQTTEERKGREAPAAA